MPARMHDIMRVCNCAWRVRVLRVGFFAHEGVALLTKFGSRALDLGIDLVDLFVGLKSSSIFVLYLAPDEWATRSSGTRAVFGK